MSGGVKEIDSSLPLTFFLYFSVKIKKGGMWWPFNPWSDPFDGQCKAFRRAKNNY